MLTEEKNNVQEIVKTMMEKARKARLEIENYTQEQIDDVCRAIGWEVFCDENITTLANMAVEETGMGIVEDKIAKHRNKVLGVLCDVLDPAAKTVGLVEVDREKGIYKYAKPVGTVVALTPVTNPTATPSNAAISILKGRNSVIFCPHPKAKKCTAKAIAFMREGLRKVNAPEDLIQVTEEPSMELTQAMMKEADLLLAVGGGPMVRAAYSSGTPAYGVGPGNSVTMLAEDCDIEDAVSKIYTSKTFDNATACSSENSMLVHKSIYDRVIGAFEKRGCYLCTDEEKEKLKKWMWVPNKKGEIGLNPKIVGKSAEDIAANAGVSIPAGCRIILVKGNVPVEKEQFAHEKLSPILTVWEYDDFKRGVQLMAEITDNCGRGHSCGIHTFNDAYADYLGLHMNSSRILVRQAQASGNGGSFVNGMPSTVAVGCGTWGHTSTTENIHYKHFIQKTWLSYPIADYTPSVEEIWGDFFKRYAK